MEDTSGKAYKMKVFYEVLPSDLGKVMYRINKYIRESAPSWAEFTTDKDNNDLQILDVIGVGSFNYLYNKKRHILLQHCLASADTPDIGYWAEKWRSAIFIASYLDLPRYPDCHYLRIPWGVDSKVFYRENQPKTYEVMTTGYIASTERVTEIAEAVYQRGKKMVHIGGGQARDELKKYLDNRTVEMFEGISDDTMRGFYSRSRYVAGMREVEGFELPILEGTLCGARGIVLDLPIYRYWYGDLVEYIQDINLPYDVKQIYDLLDPERYRPVTYQEEHLVKMRFSWEKIAKEFWKTVEELL